MTGTVSVEGCARMKESGEDYMCILPIDSTFGAKVVLHVGNLHV